MRHTSERVHALILAILAFIVVAGQASAQQMSNQSTGSRATPFIFLTLLLAGGGFLAYVNYKTHQPFGLTRRTTLRADNIIDRFVGRYTVNGSATPSQTHRGATFYRRSEPSIVLTLLLLLFGIIPGILYLFFGGHDLTLAVTTRLREGGVTEVEVIGNGRSDGSMRIAATVVDNLP